MVDDYKINDQLKADLDALRQRIAELETSEAGHIQAERALTMERNLLRALIDSLPDHLYVKDANSRFIINNLAHIRALGARTQAEVIGKTDLDLYPRELAESYYTDEQAVIQSGKALVDREEPVAHQGTGQRMWASVTKVVLTDPQGQTIGLVGISRDITERKRAEEALRNSEKLFHSLIESLPLNIFSKDLEGRFTFANQRYCQTEKKTLAEIQGKTDFDLHPATVAPQYLDDDRYVIETGQTLEKIEEHQPTGEEKFYVQVIKTPIYDTDENISGILGIFWDITERIRAEESLKESNYHLGAALSQLKAMQEQMLQQERLAAVGQLAAGIAHDFNNSLTGILGFAELLLKQFDLSETARVKVKHIALQGQRAAHLVRQILDFSRKSIPRPHRFDLRPMLEETVKLLKSTIPENIHINLNLEPGAYPVNADISQLQQVLTNLAVNARDAMPAGGQLKFTLALLSLQKGQSPPCPNMPPGTWVELSVEDTGTGISSDVLPHIFEPFFTTKDVGVGTGLGLAQVYGIIRQHGGYIAVNSRVGRGTTFSLFLPVLSGEELVTQLDISPEIPHGHGEVLLLVEDNPTVLAVSQAQLEHLNYKVLTAAGGEEALAVFSLHQSEITLVLSDMVMPGMSGVMLYHALRRQSPDIKMVLMTGYPLGAESADILAQGIVAWLQKPLNISQLAVAVDQVLRQG